MEMAKIVYFFDIAQNGMTMQKNTPQYRSKPVPYRSNCQQVPQSKTDCIIAPFIIEAD